MRIEQEIASSPRFVTVHLEGVIFTFDVSNDTKLSCEFYCSLRCNLVSLIPISVFQTESSTAESDSLQTAVVEIPREVNIAFIALPHRRSLLYPRDLVESSFIRLSLPFMRFHLYAT